MTNDYGMTPEDVTALLQAQGGVCAICGEPPTDRALALDHDPVTRCFRGFVCGRCNVRLAILDKTDWVVIAQAYLARPQAHWRLLEGSATCTHCGFPMPENTGAGRQRLYCNVTCRVQANRRRSFQKRDETRQKREPTWA